MKYLNIGVLRGGAAALVILASGCAGKAESSNGTNGGSPGPMLAPNEPVTETAFYVSEYFSPSGHMGDGAVAGNIVQDINAECLARPMGAGGDCYHWQYTPDRVLWYGVYWQYPANNWGNEVGRDVSMWVAEPSLGPTAIRMRYNRVRFYAAATRAGSPLEVKFYAGKISDISLTSIHCPDRTQPCRHRDFVSTREPTLMLTSQLQPFSLDLTVNPPCVATVDADGFVTQARFGDNGCPDGTVRAGADGTLEVATCLPMHAAGALMTDGSVMCCMTPLVSGMCPQTDATFAGSWKPLDEIYETVIGGFGWALNYSEYERQLAIDLSNGALPPGTTVDPTTLPPTHLYIDDVVWDYVAD